MIKYTTANPPPFVTNQEVTRPGHPIIGQTFADFVTMLGNAGTDRLFEGDYIAQDANGNPLEIIRAAQALAQADRIALELGQDLKRTIRASIKGMNLSAADKVDLFDRILAVWVLLDDGDLQGARYKAFNTPTGGAYLAGRKSGLVALIDTAIQSLPA